MPPAATMAGRNVDVHFLLSAVIAARVGMVDERPGGEVVWK